jgi:hypothetical protein
MSPFLVISLCGLLAVACTSGSSPDEQSQLGEGTKSGLTFLRTKSGLRFLKPGKRIIINPTVLGASNAMYSPRSPRFDPERASVLVAGLRRDQPTWLRYIQTVSVIAADRLTAFPVTAGVQTGIFPNEPGKEVGRKICRSLLNRGMERAGVAGTPRDGMPTVLAKCPVKLWQPRTP